ncbi:MAG: peptidoglycan DD-metalloendopeptidase family protein [Halioglobus sp.]
MSSGSTYTVQRGDTLYSIAFRYGLDFRRVAAANGIRAPYTIFPGQKVLLKEKTPVASSPARSSTSTVKTYPATPPASSGSTASKAKTAPVAKASSAPAAKPVTKTKIKTTTTTTASAGGPVRRWQWPTTGRVTRRYSATVHKGIDLAGRRGDPVVAVAAGKVVYSGTGIAGFGELLIVKHNDVYLSAYGHNDRLLVAEGDTVTAGQRIAQKGSSGTDTVKLHFEIRKEGKPIDPLTVLPPR